MLLKLFCSEFAALREPALDKNRLATVEPIIVRERWPIRCGHQHFIALVEGRGEGVENNLLGPVGNHDGGQRIVQVIFTLELALHGNPQGFHARRRRVLGGTGGNGGISSLLDVFGRVEIRFAGGQVENVLTCLSQLGGTGLGGGVGRQRDALHALGQVQCHDRASCNTLPGLSRLCGSRVCLMRRIRSSSTALL
ncbi:hypothetical protein D3C76_1164180 [compost metagenome]